MRRLARWYLKLRGWTIVGTRPTEPRLVVAAALILTCFWWWACPTAAQAHGQAFDGVVVTSAEPASSGGVTFSIALNFADGHAVAGAEVKVTAVTETGSSAQGIALESEPGVYTTTLDLGDAPTWEVTVVVDHPMTHGSVRFVETVAELEAGDVVRVDTNQPERQGTTVATTSTTTTTSSATNVTTAVAGEASTASATQPTPTTAIPQVVVSIPSPADDLRRQIGTRWLHLAALATWAGAIIALAVTGRRVWRWPAVLGVVLVAATGFGLALWGAPIGYPGLLDWSALADRRYGSAYQAAFLVKMGFAAVAVVGTAFAVAGTKRGRVVVTLGGLAGAALAVTAMSQFHLLAHL